MLNHKAGLVQTGTNSVRERRDRCDRQQKPVMPVFQNLALQNAAMSRRRAKREEYPPVGRWVSVPAPYVAGRRRCGMAIGTGQAQKLTTQ
jgi:hypothetical protein